MLLLEAVLPDAVVYGAVRIDGFLPPDYVIAVPRTFKAVPVRLRFAARVVADIQRQLAQSLAPPDSQVHVVRESYVPMLVEKITAGDAIGGGPKGDPHDTRSEDPGVARVVPQPGGMNHAVGVVGRASSCLPAIFNPANDVLHGQIGIEPEDVNVNGSSIFAAIVAFVTPVSIVYAQRPTDFDGTFFSLLRCRERNRNQQAGHRETEQSFVSSVVLHAFSSIGMGLAERSSDIE